MVAALPISNIRIRVVYLERWCSRLAANHVARDTVFALSECVFRVFLPRFSNRTRFSESNDQFAAGDCQSAHVFCVLCVADRRRVFVRNCGVF